jgi:hypothetical protein
LEQVVQQLLHFVLQFHKEMMVTHLYFQQSHQQVEEVEVLLIHQRPFLMEDRVVRVEEEDLQVVEHIQLEV